MMKNNNGDTIWFIQKTKSSLYRLRISCNVLKHCSLFTIVNNHYFGDNIDAYSTEPDEKTVITSKRTHWRVQTKGQQPDVWKQKVFDNCWNMFPQVRPLFATEEKLSDDDTKRVYECVFEECLKELKELMPNEFIGEFTLFHFNGAGHMEKTKIENPSVSSYVQGW